MLNVTSSWDDGDVLDLKLAALLDKYTVTGTFYVSKHYRPQNVSEQNIRELAQKHEIGAHTLTHPDLRNLSRPEKVIEIRGSKEWLEGVLGKEVPMFCYPTGLYDAETIEVVKEVGFTGARTTELGRISKGKNNFEMPTTLQVYPFPFRKVDKNHLYWGKLLQPYQQRSGALYDLGVFMYDMRSWLAVAKATFDKVAEKNEAVFHLWGHSWEIDKYDMWDDLDVFLKYISGRPDCIYQTNGELI